MLRQNKQVIAAFILHLSVSLVVVSNAESMHRGGVGACDNCHSAHNAKDKGSGGGSQPNALLLASDPSSICLNCHAGQGGPNIPSVFSPDGSALTPGGDFYWLTATFSWPGGSSPEETHGHNIVAADFNLVADSRLVQSPGGTYESAALGCTSCHDPHGRVQGGTRAGTLPVSVSGSYGEQPVPETVAGNYRLLGDAQYTGGNAAEGYSFNYDAPVARQNSNNRYFESDVTHVDYGSGMSEWCGNCHEALLRTDHYTGDGNFEHPSGNSAILNSEIVSMYNSYIRTGDLLGNSASAYLQFVPFERGTDNIQLLDPTSTKGPNASSRVMCLSCHRAHASAFKSIGRWDFEAVLLADSHPAYGDAGLTGNEVLYSYYGRDVSVEFGPDQGSFCEKCHGIVVDPGSEPVLNDLPGTQMQFLQPPSWEGRF